jgi:hypothetical protein
MTIYLSVNDVQKRYGNTFAFLSRYLLSKAEQHAKQKGLHVI